MDSGKLISCFPTFKEIQNVRFMNLRQMPQNNMPVLRDTVSLNQKKQANYF